MDQQQPKLITDREITIKEFSKICRFCMSRCDILETIFKEDTYSTEQTITTMFTECLHLDIDSNAELPLCICPECIEKLVNCYNFRKQCVNSHNRLTEIWKKEQNASESPSQDDDNAHMDVEKIFCLEPKIKEENSDDENEEVQTVVSDISTSRVQFSGDGDSTDNIQGTNVKKKVGRPKKPIEEKVVKAPGMCQICGGLYVGLKYHMFVHEVPKFECDYCGRKFKHKSNLFAHVRIHANDRKHQCPHCPYKFQDRAKYLRHLKIHTGERNISCDICGKSFCRKTDMLKHRLIHDVPRVPCPYCDKMFTTKTNMLSHIGIHTGERNFKCETCGAAFTASSSLSNHRKIHKKENPVIKCKECGIVLADTAMLKNHMRDHQNIVMLE
ncbi:gastrula zinc finger protein XlCGF57.1-like [Bradysia coprophila]|uniref:gastrula zinc finger protein XlCGF57.1-like n=1 Tax=Bradysia coprophila TaxID=38358 RepID=UPI00187DBE99|nr:gastrula zinc finger protein XlCGF57.1-like [Bradysia coprophila]